MFQTFYVCPIWPKTRIFCSNVVVSAEYSLKNCPIARITLVYTTPVPLTVWLVAELWRGFSKVSRTRDIYESYVCEIATLMSRMFANTRQSVFSNMRHIIICQMARGTGVVYTLYRGLGQCILIMYVCNSRCSVYTYSFAGRQLYMGTLIWA